MDILAASNAWILDIVFFVLLLGGLIGGIACGFVRGICKIAGTVFSLIVAFFFCNQFCALLEGWFGLTTKLAGAIGSANLAYWIMVVCSFIVLAVLVRLLAWLLGKIGKALVESSTALNVVDRVLGGVLGALEMMILLLLVMLLFRWLAIDAVDAYIAQSWVVSKIYMGNWLDWIAAFPAKFLG